MSKAPAAVVEAERDKAGRGAVEAAELGGAVDAPVRSAERYLLSLELFGMRFGLDRMRRLMTALGDPQRRFASIHVVGTNGKSSTTRMIAAILRPTGCAPARTSRPTWCRSGSGSGSTDADLESAAFAAAVHRAAPPHGSSTARWGDDG